MKLRNRLGYLNVLPEERPGRKLSSSFTILIYFSLLSAIFLYLFFYTLSDFFYVTARGHVELSKYFVQTDRSGKIARFLVRSEEKVVTGQPLFEIREQSSQKNTFDSGSVTGRSNGYLQARMLSLEQLLSDFARKDVLSSAWGRSGGVSGSRELAKVVSDIKYIQSRLRGLNREIQSKRAVRRSMRSELSEERVLELEKYGKRIIPVQFGVAKDIGKFNREIVRLETSLGSSKESLARWKNFRKSLGREVKGEQGVLLSREFVRINNEVKSRRTALSLLKRQLSDKTESREKLKSDFTEARILELGSGSGTGGSAALNNEINDLTYKIADHENKVESLVSYRRDLVNNKIKSLEYRIREDIRKIVELRRNRMDGSEQYKMIAKELKFVSLDEKVKELLNKKNALESKLNSLVKSGTNLAENKIEKLKYEISREQYANEQAVEHVNGGLGYLYRPGSGYGNFVSSPVDGSVILLYRREGEYAKKGDILLSIREKDADVKVKGFFKTRNMNSIQPEKEVVVKFPDKTRSPGVIKKYYSSLSRNTGYTRSPSIEPPEIVVDIVPRDPSDARLWERYDQLEVSIEVRK